MLETLANTYEQLHLHTQQIMTQLQCTECPETKNALYNEYQILDRQLLVIEHQLSQFPTTYSDAS